MLRCQIFTHILLAACASHIDNSMGDLVIDSIPPDFEVAAFNVPFMDLIGPIYRRSHDPLGNLGMLIEKRHCNLAGVAQGGLLMTLADAAAARMLVVSRGKAQAAPIGSQGALSISLNTDFVGTAPLGAWIEAYVDVKKSQGSVGFAVCEIRHGDRIIMTASGAFKFIVPRPLPEQK